MKESSPDAKTQAPLSAEQKRILTSKSFNLNRRPGELIEFLTPLAAHDRGADRTRRRFGILAASAIPVSLLLMVVFAASGFKPLIPMTLTSGFVVFLIGLAAWLKMRRADLSNNLRETVLPILNIFREDFSRDAPVHLKVDLSPPRDKKKKQSESAPYKKGSYYKVVDVMYLDPWMEGAATLNDGTALSWSVVDSIRERTARKRTARGKIKTKTKLSRKSRIEVQLGLRKSRYDVTPSPEATMKTGEKRHVVTLRRTKRADTLDPIAPEVFFDMVADIYRGVRLTRAEA